ncbi:hypothetical protein MUK42_19427 [Musa troglodytarum]|uniref:Ubiquitin-like domain-containing protein n=1 Tax=Musa troglodytarum TaxID=320322 RepID=A0A9E7FSR5_9LILI|nr:hypothetical protein MUK42_19427 [Musa troglodytarum]
MAKEDLIELKFRLSDGTDIGPNKYDPSTTVASLKEFILDRWPQDKEIAPKTINDVKLINAGKILDNNQTIAESRVPVGELPGGVITMHVVVRPPVLDKNNGTGFVDLSNFKFSKLNITIIHLRSNHPKPQSITDVVAQSSDIRVQCFGQNWAVHKNN